MSISATLDQRCDLAARNLAVALEQHCCRVVFAESCTGGMLAASLARIPGISNWFCGSMVTYRESVKSGWLNVSPDTLASHSAESLETTLEMALAVLEKTDDAAIAAAVTGHLGPGVAPDVDGWVHVVIVRRGKSEPVSVGESFRLQSLTRVERQVEATATVLEMLIDRLAE